ncbi:MAG: preprotein translocase subunit SecG [Pseudomonadota bacterium]|nr:preprotein translocase subunit SecG [Pseudomonadota bacterium]
MEIILLLVHLALAAGIITLVLLQQGKGADAGAAFGSGASATVFGARGAANFLSRTTAVLAVLFFLTSLGLGWLYANRSGPTSVVDQVLEPTTSPSEQELPPVETEVNNIPDLPPEVADEEPGN